MKKLLFVFSFFILSVFGKNIEFYDQSNNKITLKHPAKKVVTIPIPLASLSICVDKNISRLLSINPISKEAINNGILKDIFPNSVNLSTKGINSNFMPNIEELLMLNPNLIFQWSHLGEDLITPLKNAGLNVALLKYGQEKYIQQWFEMIGKAYGLEKRVDKILKHRNDIKNRLKKLTKNIKDKPKVMYFLRFHSGLRVAGKNTFNEYSIKLSGGENISNISNFKELGIEQILKYDPEIILLNNFEQDLSPKDIYSHPLLSLTKAAKNKKVYKIPLGGTRWDPPGQESPLMWLWLFKLTHPDLAKYDFSKEIKKAYKLFYDYEINEKQIKEILHFKQNKNSKNYKDIF